MESLEELSRSHEDLQRNGVTHNSASETLESDISAAPLRLANGATAEEPARDDAAPRTATLNGGLEAAQLPEAEAHIYPQLSHNPPASPDLPAKSKYMDEEDEEPNVAKSFDRSSSPLLATQRNKGALYEKVGEEGVSRMHKFSVYETATRYYIVGGDLLDQRFRILKIERTADTEDLSIAEDDIIYTKKEMNQILNAVDDGNKSSGGLKLKCSTWGLLGFIRFTGAYYMLMITKRSQVAMIGGHYIYQIDGTELVPLTSSTLSKSKAEKNPEEPRFVSILNNLDLSRSFYFSYSYDITRTLQHNIMRQREALEAGLPYPHRSDHNAMFVWNNYLLEPAIENMKSTFDWCLPIIHGYVDQATISVYGRVVNITIIARRSRFFAGARFLKRGANDLGYVANDVETEQIVAEMLTTSFHAPGPRLYANPHYTSYVQHRGSIPLHWTQDSTGVSPKPDIEMNLVDPFYGAASLHFDNLFQRYGAPIYVLNLIKSRERTPRESKLLKEYTNAISYLNQFLPSDKKILYTAWDMSRAAKSRDQDVIGKLESIADDILPTTGFFRNGEDPDSGLKLQNGVARTNCIDCLDRTNAAQFVIGKRALGYQLRALGILDGTSVEYDSDAVNLFTHMWHDHGDTIAVQYGGSHLVNTMETYRKINQWTSHSRDMVESFKRYYNNSFLDAQRQEAYNLFLGNYVFAKGQPMIWELVTDYYLHHADPRGWAQKRRPGYINWFTPEFLKERKARPAAWPQSLTERPLQYFDDYWLEYYRPLALSSLQKVFSYKMNSTLQYIPFRSTEHGRYDLSPFKVRSVNEADAAPKSTMRRKGVKIIEPSAVDSSEGNVSLRPESRSAETVETLPKPHGLDEFINQQKRDRPQYTGIIKEPSFEVSSVNPSIPPIPSSSTTPSTPTKAALALDAFTRLVARSLNPSVPDAEEYERYVSHPLQLPLVVSTQIDQDKLDANRDYVDFLEKVNWEEEALHKWAEVSVDDYLDFLEAGEREDGLSVQEGDGEKKRYKRYRQWLRGKSLFKQKAEGVGEV